MIGRRKKTLHLAPSAMALSSPGRSPLRLLPSGAVQSEHQHSQAARYARVDFEVYMSDRRILLLA
jgi:hypothetical protein